MLNLQTEIDSSKTGNQSDKTGSLKLSGPIIDTSEGSMSDNSQKEQTLELAAVVTVEI